MTANKTTTSANKAATALDRSSTYCTNNNGGNEGEYSTLAACAQRCLDDFNSVYLNWWAIELGYSGNYCQCVTNGESCAYSAVVGTYSGVNVYTISQTAIEASVEVVTFEDGIRVDQASDYCSNWEGTNAAVDQYPTPRACAQRCLDDFDSVYFAWWGRSLGYSSDVCQCVANQASCTYTAYDANPTPAPCDATSGTCGPMHHYNGAQSNL